MKRLKLVLPIIVVSQFLCTSLWFAGNAIISDLSRQFQLSENVLPHLTTAVQLGFIIGTLVFATFNISDRYRPSTVFFFSALAGSAINLFIIFEGNTFTSLFVTRCLTGFCLAGIYPVGMKIAADYFQGSLGKSLGFLVGALVLGTAFPHLLSSFNGTLGWQNVVFATSGLAAIGGVLVFLLVPDGPHRIPSPSVQLSAFIQVFRQREFRNVAIAYFGHCWELYTFWAFVPVILSLFQESQGAGDGYISFHAFLIIGSGALACVSSGYLSEKIGLRRTAFTALMLSYLCCFAAPFIFYSANYYILLSFLIFWGVAVVADSPMFSALIAKSAPAELKGTALTIVNCIGFSVTIISIQLIGLFYQSWKSPWILLALAIGPLGGLIALLSKNLKSSN